MARKYAAEVFEAIWAQLCEGKGPAEIKRLLVTDSAGVGYPVPIADRTLSDYIAKLKRERGHPHMTIRAGQEEDAALAIVRRSLEALAREQQNLTTKQKLGTQLTEPELRTLAMIGDKVASLKSRLAIVGRGDRTRDREAGKQTQVQPSALLSRLASQLNAEPVTTQHNTDGSNTDAERIAPSINEATDEAMPNSIPVMRASVPAPG